MIASKEATDREINFTGGMDVTPIVEHLYGPLYQGSPRLRIPQPEKLRNTENEGGASSGQSSVSGSTMPS
jgi:hypothetical protein